MDEAMKKILTTLHKYTSNEAMNELLADADGRIHTFVPPTPFLVGDMKITPFFVDHSAYHANMFLIEASGQTILVSGDFRSTGYLGKSLQEIPKLLKKFHKTVDVLLCEGTMMTRDVKEGKLTEWDLAKEAKKFLKTHRQAYVICSSTNFDTISSIYMAAKKNGLKVYANGYICAMLRTFSDIAAKHTGLYKLKGVKNAKQLKDEAKEGFVVLLGSCLGKPLRMMDMFYDFLTDGVKEPWLIYSMWKGYLNPKHSAYDAHLAGFVSEFGERIKYAHTSGHAGRETLARFIEEIQPRKYILPFHTENAEGNRGLDVENKYKEMVKLMKDRETIKIG
jgi:ribonuclease J